jgi:hypothetical protein
VPNLIPTRPTRSRYLRAGAARINPPASHHAFTRPTSYPYPSHDLHIRVVALPKAIWTVHNEWKSETLNPETCCALGVTRVKWIVSEARIMDARLFESQRGKRKMQRTTYSSDDEAEAKNPKIRATPDATSLSPRRSTRLSP